MKTILVLLILILPQNLFANERTSQVFLTLLKTYDNPETKIETIVKLGVKKYLSGFLDGVILTQSMMDKESVANTGVGAPQINLPSKGILIDDFVILFKSYLIKHPERLNTTARTVLWFTLVESYGLK